LNENLNVGSVIRFRYRVWRVDRIDEQEFVATPLDGRDSRRWRFLRSLEEENVQAGALPWPDSSILSDPGRQDLLLRAYRLSMIHGSAPFLGLQRSRAIPEPYQLVPLLMALEMSTVRMLLGDDVGVGKSIQAGLIMSELMARGAAERLLIAVPAALREQWVETLDRFFHLDAVVMSGTTRPALERELLSGQSPWDAYPIVVTSIDYVKSRISEVLSHRWDVVLVDEAHLCQRPHVWGGASSLQKDRWEFLEAAGKSARVRHLLLLSATPHPGYTDCFASLLEVLNPRAVKLDGSIDREAARRRIVQRRRKDIQNWYGAGAPFPRRAPPRDLIVPLKKVESTFFDELGKYAEMLRATERGAVGQWVALHLQRRALSSPGAIQASLQERMRTARRRLALHTAAAASAAEAESIVLDQDSTQDLEDEQRWKRLDTAAFVGTHAEIERLENLIALAKKVSPRQDGKLSRIFTLIPELLALHAKAPRALIFTRYKDTLEYVAKALEKEAGNPGALHGVKIFRIFGDLNQKDRRLTWREFEHTPRAVCIATDCISEGLDLQRGCAEVIHYELPWNPNRLEQRNGRLDRYGQREPVVGISTLVRKHPLDVAILRVLAEKAAKIRSEYGFCPVIFSSARELKRLLREFGGSGQQSLLPGFDLQEALPGTSTEENLGAGEKERINRIVDESFYGQEQVRLPEVEKALQQTYRTIGAPDEIQGFVLSALQQMRARVILQEDGTWIVDLRGTALAEIGENTRVTFDPRIARDDPEVDLLDIAHPLVRRLIESVQHVVIGGEDGRIAARGSSAVSEVTAIVHLLARFVTASEPPVLMEELIPFAFLPYTGTKAKADPIELLRMPAQPLYWNETDIREVAGDSLQMDGLQTLIAETVEARLDSLTRRQSEIANMSGTWAKGIDDVHVASVDLLTLTLLEPHG
jgi:ERCC4-related helicase